MADVTCKVVSRSGTSGPVYAQFPVNVERIRFAGGGSDPAPGSFTVHPFEPGVGALAPEYLGGHREVQLWEGGKCRWWGWPLTSNLASLDAIRYNVVDLKQAYLRRYFGPIRQDFITNGDFEAGMTGWTAVGTTATIDTTWKARGTQSCRLDQATAGTDTYIRQRFAVTTTTDPVLFVVKGMFRRAAAGWVGPAYAERGLYAEVQSTPGGGVAPGTEPDWDSITNSTEPDSAQPILLKCAVSVPAGGTYYVEVRAMSPGGRVWVDSISARRLESVGSDVPGTAPDVLPAETVLDRINGYANDPTQGKSDLFLPVTIVGGPAPDIEQHWQFYANGNVLEAMNDFVERRLLDWDITWADDGSGRSLTIWASGRGSYLAAPILDVPNPGGNPIMFPGNVVEPLSYSGDGAGVVTKPRRTGLGSEAAQEVYEAEDASLMGGLTLESVAASPTDVPTDAIDALVRADLQANRAPQKRCGYSLPAELVWGRFWVGDTVRVVSDYGPAIQDDEAKRVDHLDWDGTRIAVGWQNDA